MVDPWGIPMFDWTNPDFDIRCGDVFTVLRSRYFYSNECWLIYRTRGTLLLRLRPNYDLASSIDDMTADLGANGVVGMHLIWQETVDTPVRHRWVVKRSLSFWQRLWL